MKKLGLVGGLGPEATLRYYRDIVYAVQERSGRPGYPPMTVESLNVYRVLELAGAGERSRLADYLAGGIERLAASGAEFAAFCAATPETVMDLVRERSPLPVISLVDAVADEAARRGYHRVAALGTGPTMAAGLFNGALAGRDVVALTPGPAEREFIATAISDELEQGIVTAGTRAGMVNVLERMAAEENAEAVILGCTELPMALDDEVSPIPCLDAAEIHIRRIVDEIADEDGDGRRGEESA